MSKRKCIREICSEGIKLGLMDFHNKVNQIKQSRLFKDAFWAVFGNGLGNALLLLAGIVIARFLGRDLYGEYGVVKTNMFYMAGFSTFGLVYSSTRYIAKYLSTDRTRIIPVIRSAIRITLLFSCVVAIAIALMADTLEKFLETPGISSAFRVLSIVIVLKAMASTGNGILAGLGEFSIIARTNVLSGLCMLATCIPLTYYWGLKGAFTSLAISQLFNLLLNYWHIYRDSKRLPIYYRREDKATDLLKFSFPIALQEISYAVCNWVGIMMLTKLATVSEVGIYSASAQWNAVIIMIPGLLSNVVLSHLSRSKGLQQHRLTYRLLAIYFACTIVPFLIVYALTDFIVSFYGSDFASMKWVLRISILSTIPGCCSEVFKAELIAVGKTWILFTLRVMKDICLVVAAAYLLVVHSGENGAYYYALSNLLGSILFFFGAFWVYFKLVKLNAGR